MRADDQAGAGLDSGVRDGLLIARHLGAAFQAEVQQHHHDVGEGAGGDDVFGHLVDVSPRQAGGDGAGAPALGVEARTALDGHIDVGQHRHAHAVVADDDGRAGRGFVRAGAGRLHLRLAQAREHVGQALHTEV